MNKAIFTINEIISIAMETVDKLEAYEIYGLNDDGEFNIPKQIINKLESLNKRDYEEFMSKISYIAEEILPIKSGELNELNHCHEEITFIAKDILEMYIKDI